MKKIDDKKVMKKEDDSVDQVKKFIIILFGVAIICLLAYFFTAKVLVKEEPKKKSTDITIEYTNVDVGNIFNRPYDNYYVLALDESKDDASYYQNMVATYSSESNSKKIYSLDLSLSVNKKYVGKSNKRATKASEVSLSNPTLIEIENGKIKNYYDTKESITNALE